MATQVINPGRNDDNSTQLLASALGIARDLYKVKLDDRQAAAAAKLTSDKLTKEEEDKLATNSINFAKDFEIVKPGTRGAIDPAATGLQLPRGLNIPQGMAIRPRSVAENDVKLAAAAAEKANTLAAKAPAQTMGQKALDTSFARDFNDWETTGKSTVQKNLGLLNEVLTTLEERKGDTFGTSGRFTGALPDVLRSEESIRLRDDVHRAAQATLRATLGPAFTEKEGVRIMNASYNEKLSPAENIKKIKSTIEELVQNAQNMEARARYFEENGTLKGLKSSGMQTDNVAEEKASGPVKLKSGAVVERTPDIQAAALRELEKRKQGTASK